MRDLGSRGTRVVGAMGAVALLTLAACGGDGTGPGTTQPTLDAAAMGATADRLAAITSQPVIVAMLAQSSSAALPSFNRGVGRIPRLVASASRLVPSAGPARTSPAVGVPRPMLAAAIGGGTALIPDTLLGKTLVPNAQGSFTVNPSVTGAPANGVRFVIRALGTTQDLGYADLTETVSGATFTLTLDVKTTSGTLLMHDVETTTTSGSNETDSYTGYATNGTDRIDYTVNLQTVGARTVATSTFGAPSADVAVADTSVVDGMTATDVNVARMTIGSIVVRVTASAVADPEFGGYLPSDTSKVTVNGTPFATVVIGSSGAPSVTAPNGGPLSANDTRALVSTMGMLSSVEVVLLAPLAVVLWLLVATSGF